MSTPGAAELCSQILDPWTAAEPAAAAAAAGDIGRHSKKATYINTFNINIIIILH